MFAIVLIKNPRLFRAGSVKLFVCQLPIVAALISVSEWIYISYLWRPNLIDEADNHLVELAIAGNASAIVTNNTKDFRGADLVFPDLAIINPQDMIRS